MTWVKLTDDFYENRKIARAGSFAVGVWIASIAYSNRNLTDGFIPRATAHGLAVSERVDGEGRIWEAGESCGMSGQDMTGRRAAETLCEIGLWDEADGGYQIHDYHDYQPSRAEVIALRESKSAAGKAGAEARWGKPKPDPETMAPDMAPAMANGWQNDAPTPGSQPQTPSSRSTVNHSAEGGSAQGLTVNDKTINPSTAASIERLLERLPDANQRTVGRLVNLARRGANQADFEDARSALSELSPSSPSRYACQIISERMEGRP